MQNNVIETVLSKTSKRTVMTTIVNFISTIPDSEEIAIAFKEEENTDGLAGKSRITLTMEKKSKTPEIKKVVDLSSNTEGHINVEIS